MKHLSDIRPSVCVLECSIAYVRIVVRTYQASHPRWDRLEDRGLADLGLSDRLNRVWLKKLGLTDLGILGDFYFHSN